MLLTAYGCGLAALVILKYPGALLFIPPAGNKQGAEETPWTNQPGQRTSMWP